MGNRRDAEPCSSHRGGFGWSNHCSVGRRDRHLLFGLYQEAIAKGCVLVEGRGLGNSSYLVGHILKA